ncbi:hypothetical protein Cni_G00193 [Canna indica]|uniref:Dof-type domain-containing protein n=1 Tax=Canna indica TaxID=4628 RepID=A0AAQ3JM93_9LILI|nr:hypothetical protein Cni_G00193 [Canna indica]
MGEVGEASTIKLFGKVILREDKRPKEKKETPPPATEGEAQEEAAARAAAMAAAPLPCPRCKSKETKFCYFNNYNVNQPRHFCKACHRYWTAGGALRNVPVGAGRRRGRPAAPRGGGSAPASSACVLEYPASSSPYLQHAGRWLLRPEAARSVEYGALGGGLC